MTNSSIALVPDKTVSFLSLLKLSVIDAEGKSLGRLEDATARIRDGQYPLLTGLVIVVNGARAFVPSGDILAIEQERVKVNVTRMDPRRFERRESEVLLRDDVLRHRLLDVDRSTLTRAYDIRLTLTVDGWVATGLDVHKHHWFHFGAHENHLARDWHAFLLLTGDKKSLINRFAASRLKRLKPAQIADIIESASTQEQNLLLARVHADPEFEADVFEELDEDRQSRLFRSRSDADVADVLSRMRSDDVADAIMDLPQVRRRKVLDLLPKPQSTKVLALLSYSAATAGGLMGTDYIALPESRTVADALQLVRGAITQQPEALITIYSLHSDGTLAGALGLVRALQIDPTSLLLDAADKNIIAASPHEDVIAVTTRMADFNLLTLPVLDAQGRILGIVTVDDALEAAIPRDWTQRAPAGLASRPSPQQTD